MDVNCTCTAQKPSALVRALTHMHTCDTFNLGSIDWISCGKSYDAASVSIQACTVHIIIRSSSHSYFQWTMDRQTIDLYILTKFEPVQSNIPIHRHNSHIYIAYKFTNTHTPPPNMIVCTSYDTSNNIYIVEWLGPLWDIQIGVPFNLPID